MRQPIPPPDEFSAGIKEWFDEDPIGRSEAQGLTERIEAAGAPRCGTDLTAAEIIWYLLDQAGYGDG